MESLRGFAAVLHSTCRIFQLELDMTAAVCVRLCSTYCFYRVVHCFWIHDTWLPQGELCFLKKTLDVFLLHTNCKEKQIARKAKKMFWPLLIFVSSITVSHKQAQSPFSVVVLYIVLVITSSEQRNRKSICSSSFTLGL